MTATAERADAQPQSETPVLEFDEVALSFAGVKAIDGVSFTVGGSELFAIIGPNGAGKTSIFNVLSGVYRPQSGRVTFGGTDLLGRRPDEIAQLGIARTFQNIELFANLTVLDNLMLGCHHHHPYGVLSSLVWLGKARRSELLNRAAVEDIDRLSGARAVAADPWWANCLTACRNAWSSAVRWQCSQNCYSSTSR